MRTHPDDVYAVYNGERMPHASNPGPKPEAWDDEKDGSELLRSMILRRDERLAATGEWDEDTSALIVLLRQIEKRSKDLELESEDLIQACFDRMALIGAPEEDDWTDYGSYLARRNYWRDR